MRWPAFPTRTAAGDSGRSDETGPDSLHQLDRRRRHVAGGPEGAAPPAAPSPVDSSGPGMGGSDLRRTRRGGSRGHDPESIPGGAGSFPGGTAAPGIRHGSPFPERFRSGAAGADGAHPESDRLHHRRPATPADSRRAAPNRRSGPSPDLLLPGSAVPVRCLAHRLSE